MIEASFVRRFVASGLAVFATVISLVTLGAEEPSLHDARFCAPNGIALGGYDVVSYFQASGPVPGKAALFTERNGLSYRFASQANLVAFEADPERYLPTYLGWCSATLSMGRLACPDFTNYKIENGSLLLFERIGFENGLDMWNLDPTASRRSADGHFLRLDEAARANR